MAARISSIFASFGFVSALDYSKAYDHMAPELTRSVLLTEGVYEELVELMTTVWKGQKRRVKFDNHLSEEWLETDEAHPQGGPWGPPVMQAWMVAGLAALKRDRTEEAEDEGEQGKEPSLPDEEDEVVRWVPEWERGGGSGKGEGNGKR